MASISVYITSYNQRDLLRQAIESVLAQTLPASQIIVVDDCSSDGSQDLIADYARKHTGLFTPIYHRSNTGVGQARADALAAVTGDLVTYVDGDDSYLPTKLEKEASALEETPEADIAFSNNRWFSSDGRIDYLWIEDEPPPQGDVFAETFARAYPRNRLFRMELVRYAVWREIGFHDPSLPIFEDWDMRIRLARRCRTVYVDEPLSEIRRDGGGLSSASPETFLEVAERIIRKNRSLLKHLSRTRRQWVMTRLCEWIAPRTRLAARQTMAEERRWSGQWHALRLWLRAFRWSPSEADYYLLACIVAPRTMARRRAAASRSQGAAEKRP